MMPSRLEAGPQQAEILFSVDLVNHVVGVQNTHITLDYRDRPVGPPRFMPDSGAGSAGTPTEHLGMGQARNQIIPTMTHNHFSMAKRPEWALIQ